MANYYVDPNAPNGGTGTFEAPFNSIAQLNAMQFETSDRVYFRAGTTMHVTTFFSPRWSGTANNRAVIGAYYGKDQFGLGGLPRPLLIGSQDDENPIPNSPYAGIVNYLGEGYMTVRDLHIKNSRAGGVFMQGRQPPDRDPSVNNEIINNVIENSGRQGIIFGRCSYGLVENNIIDTTSTIKVLLAYGVWAHGGAGLEITGSNNPSEPYVYNVARGNILLHCHESLGIYGGARYTTVEDNIVYDTSQVSIYATNSRNGIIRNNIVYNPDPLKSTHWRQPENGRRNGIWIDCEGQVQSTIKVAGDWEVHNNYVAGFVNGIWLNNHSKGTGLYQKNNKIHDNIIVDCDKNIYVSMFEPGWSGNEIYDNYSFIYTAGLQHVVGPNATGVTWYNNHYNTTVAAAPTGNAGNQAVINGVRLLKTAGWRDLPVGLPPITADWFAMSPIPPSQIAAAQNLRVVT